MQPIKANCITFLNPDGTLGRLARTSPDGRGTLDTSGLEVSRIRREIAGLLSISPYLIRLEYEAPFQAV
jgi:hypothetical protein